MDLRRTRCAPSPRLRGEGWGEGGFRVALLVESPPRPPRFARRPLSRSRIYPTSARSVGARTRIDPSSGASGERWAVARPMPALLPTTLVGSYPQPEWLIDRAALAGQMPPRVRARELWRIAPEHLEQAQDDATLLAIRDQERAGLDIVTDGEQRRESYSNRF